MSMNFGNPEVLEAVPNETTIKPAVIGGAAEPLLYRRRPARVTGFACPAEQWPFDTPHSVALRHGGAAIEMHDKMAYPDPQPPVAACGRH